MLEKGKAKSWCQPEEELVCHKEISHRGDVLSDYLAGQPGVETMTD